MIRPISKIKPVSSIKKAEKSLERKTVKANNGDEPLVGRSGYFFCEGECKDYSVHRVYVDHTKCWSCGHLYHFHYRGVEKNKEYSQVVNLFII